MGDLFLLSERQRARISPYFPLAHGVPCVDDRRVVSGVGESPPQHWHHHHAIASEPA
jgi:hypothetical protein